SLVFQVPGHAAIPVAATVRDRQLLDPSAQLHGFDLGFPLFPVAIKAGTADPRHSTHQLDTEGFVRLLYASYFFLDAVSPQPLLARRRPLILRKASCKKSASSTFLPSAARSC